MKPFIPFLKLLLRLVKASLAGLIATNLLLAWPNHSNSMQLKSGEELFIEHCAGCHINGGNVIRRGKTLKLSALKKNGLDNPEAIARVAIKGIGIMSGYEKDLVDGGEKLVAKWIWEQAQNAWTQG